MWQCLSYKGKVTIYELIYKIKIHHWLKLIYNKWQRPKITASIVDVYNKIYKLIQCIFSNIQIVIYDWGR